MAAQALQNSLSLNGPMLALPDATSFYRKSVEASIKININLNPKAEADLRRMCDFPFSIEPAKDAPIVGDHMVLDAARMAVREVFARMVRVKESMMPTLIVGSTMREVTSYESNPMVMYHFHASEAKDTSRIIVAALNKIGRELKAKSAKQERKLRAERKTPVGTLRRAMNLKAMLDTINDLEPDLPPRFVLNPVRATRLIFEDSIYNLKAKDIYDWFKNTGAIAAYGYALLPFELVFDDMPENPYYVLEKGALRDAARCRLYIISTGTLRCGLPGEYIYAGTD